MYFRKIFEIGRIACPVWEMVKSIVSWRIYVDEIDRLIWKIIWFDLIDRRNDSELIKDRKIKKSYPQALYRSILTLIRFAMPCNDFRIFSRERFQHAIPRFETSLIFSFPLENIFTIFLRTWERYVRITIFFPT